MAFPKGPLWDDVQALLDAAEEEMIRYYQYVDQALFIDQQVLTEMKSRPGSRLASLEGLRIRLRNYRNHTGTLADLLVLVQSEQVTIRDLADSFQRTSPRTRTALLEVEKAVQLIVYELLPIEMQKLVDHLKIWSTDRKVFVQFGSYRGQTVKIVGGKIDGKTVVFHPADSTRQTFLVRVEIDGIDDPVEILMDDLLLQP